MILVNSPGNQTPYTWLEHSAWNGCTLADLVFPFFIIIVGISSVLAFTRLKNMGFGTNDLLEKVIRRSAYIFFMGLLLNAVPHCDPYTLRILGVLQRIAICYFFSALLFLTTRVQAQVIIMMALLVGFGCLMSYTPTTLDGNVIGVVDRLVLTSAHLYTPTFDPEGLLSTLPAIASVLLGNLIGVCVTSSQTQQQKLQWMSVAGIMLVILGVICSVAWPINKALWSPSYVLFTGGIALLVFSIIYYVIEIKNWIQWSRPFDLFGRHAMLVYVLHVLGLKIQSIIFMQNMAGMRINCRLYLTQLLFGSFRPENAALCYAISYTLLWFCVIKGVDAWQRYRRKITFRQNGSLC
jgi:predicted acyltransferase